MKTIKLSIPKPNMPLLVIQLREIAGESLTKCMYSSEFGVLTVSFDNTNNPGLEGQIRGAINSHRADDKTPNQERLEEIYSHPLFKAVGDDILTWTIEASDEEFKRELSRAFVILRAALLKTR